MDIFDQLAATPTLPPQRTRKANSLDQWGRMLGRGALDTGALFNRSAQAVSDIGGRAFGIRPEDNPVSQWQQSVINETERMKRDNFAPDEQWVQEHPVQNFTQGLVEGALPYVGAGLITSRLGHAALPALAGLSTEAKYTHKLMNEGMDSDEAMLRAAAPAAAETAMFAMMPYATSKVMGKFVPTEGVFSDLATKQVGNKVFQPGMIAKTAPQSALGKIGREAAFMGPYLHGQTEAIEGASLLSGAKTLEDYQKEHGYDPNADTMTNVRNVGMQQLQSFGSSFLTGAGFGAIGAVKEARADRKMQKNWQTFNAVMEGKKNAEDNFTARQTEVQRQHAEDVASGTAAATMLPDASPLEEQARIQRDTAAINHIEGERQATLQMTVRELAMEEQRQAGWNHDWPFVPADLGNRNFVEGIANDPSISEAEKQQIFEAGKKLGTVSRNFDYRTLQQEEAINGLRQEEEIGNMVAPEEQPALSPYYQELAEHAKHPIIQNAASAINKLNEERGSALVAPEYLVNAAKAVWRKIVDAGKAIKDKVKYFSDELINRFGPAIKPHILKLMNWVKNVNQQLGERGSVVLRDDIPEGAMALYRKHNMQLAGLHDSIARLIDKGTNEDHPRMQQLLSDQEYLNEVLADFEESWPGIKDATQKKVQEVLDKEDSRKLATEKNTWGYAEKLKLELAGVTDLKYLQGLLSSKERQAQRLYESGTPEDMHLYGAKMMDVSVIKKRINQLTKQPAPATTPVQTLSVDLGSTKLRSADSIHRLCDYTSEKTAQKLAQQFGTENVFIAHGVGKVTWHDNTEKTINHRFAVANENGEWFVYDMPQSKIYKYADKNNVNMLTDTFIPERVKLTSKNYNEIFGGDTKDISVQKLDSEGYPKAGQMSHLDLHPSGANFVEADKPVNKKFDQAMDSINPMFDRLEERRNSIHSSKHGQAWKQNGFKDSKNIYTQLAQRLLKFPGEYGLDQGLFAAFEKGETPFTSKVKELPEYSEIQKLMQHDIYGFNRAGYQDLYELQSKSASYEDFWNKYFDLVEHLFAKGEQLAATPVQQEAVKQPNEDKIVHGDIWAQQGKKVVPVNLGGIHGAGLAKQAEQKGLITRKQHRQFDEYTGGEVIPVAVKGHEPATAKVKGQAWSETTTGKNVKLLESEIDKVIDYARKNPQERINLPFVGLGHGEGKAEEILPILHRAAQEPNIYLVSADKATFEKYRSTVTGKTRVDQRAVRMLSEQPQYGFKLSQDKLGKDQGKASLANAYIGYGAEGRKSSTGVYAEDAKRQSIPVNESIKPDSNTRAFVSVSSEGRKADIDRTVAQAKRVLDAGGYVIMDAQGTEKGQSHSSWNKNGEGVVQDILGQEYGSKKSKDGYTLYHKDFAKPAAPASQVQKTALSEEKDSQPIRNHASDIDTVLKAIESEETTHMTAGDRYFKHLAKSFISGKPMEYSVGQESHSVSVPKKLMDFAVRIYQKNFEVFAKHYKGNSETDWRALSDENFHTGAVEDIWKQLTEMNERSKSEQIPEAKVSDAFSPKILAFEWTKQAQGSDYGNVAICHGTSESTMYRLRKAGLPSDIFSMAQRDVFGNSGKDGDHRVAITIANDKSYLVDMPQKEMFEPHDPPVPNQGKIKSTTFRPRFIEATTGNIQRLYGLSQEEAQRTVDRINSATKKLQPIAKTPEDIIRNISKEYGQDLDDSSIVDSQPIRDHAMSYVMAKGDNIWGEPTSTLKEAESGRRTATTRGYKLGNVGDVITFEGKPQQYVITGHEQLTKEKATNPEWVKAWSAKEGWTPEKFQKFWKEQGTVRDGAWQTSFQRLQDAAASEGIPNPALEKKTAPTPTNGSEKGISEDGDALIDAETGELKIDRLEQLEEQLDYFKEIEPSTHIDGVINPEYRKWKREYNRLRSLYDELTTIAPKDLDDAAAQKILDANSEDTQRSTSKNYQGEEQVPFEDMDIRNPEEIAEDDGDLTPALYSSNKGAYQETGENAKEDVGMREEYRIQPAMQTIEWKVQKNPSTTIYKEIEKTNKETESKIASIENIIKLKKYFREEIKQDDGTKIPLYRFLGDALREITMVKDIYDDNALHTDKVLQKLFDEHGAPHQWDEIPDALLDLVSEYAQGKEQNLEHPIDVKEEMHEYFRSTDTVSGKEAVTAIFSAIRKAIEHSNKSNQNIIRDPKLYDAFSEKWDKATGKNLYEMLNLATHNPEIASTRKSVMKVLRNPERFKRFMDEVDNTVDKYTLQTFQEEYGSSIDKNVLEALNKYKENLHDVSKMGMQDAPDASIKLDNLGNILLDREGKPIKVDNVPERKAKENEPVEKRTTLDDLIADTKQQDIKDKIKLSEFIPQAPPKTPEEARAANEAHYANLKKEAYRNSIVYKLIPHVFDAMFEIQYDKTTDRNASRMISADIILKKVLSSIGKETAQILQKVGRKKQLEVIGAAMSEATMQDGMFDYYWTSPEARGEQGEIKEVIKHDSKLAGGKEEFDYETSYPVSENTENKAPLIDNADPYYHPFESDERPASMYLFPIERNDNVNGKHYGSEGFKQFFEVTYKEVDEEKGTSRIRTHKVNQLKLDELRQDPQTYQGLKVKGIVGRDGVTYPFNSPQGKELLKNAPRMQTIQNWDYYNNREAVLKKLIKDYSYVDTSIKGDNREWYTLGDSRALELLEKLQAAEELTGKAKNEAREEIDKGLLQLKKEIVQKAFTTDRVMDPKVFERDAERLQGQGITVTPPELYAAYRNSGGSMLAYQSKLAELARSELRKLSQLTPPSKMIPAGKAPETSYVAKVFGKLHELTIATPEAIQEARRQDAAVTKMLAEREKVAQEAREAAYAAAIEPPVEAIFEPKANKTAEDASVEKYFSTPDNPVRVGSFRDKMTQKFFDGLSSLFGARTIVLSDSSVAFDGAAFKGGYFPNTKGGPAIVINANSGLSMSRVFAHELFHHIVNKVSPASYSEFSKALKASTNQVVWNRALKNLADRGIVNGNEELHSEIFADAIQHPEFWKALSETEAGRTLSGKLAFGLLENITKVLRYISKLGHGAKELQDTKVSRMMVDWFGDKDFAQGQLFKSMMNIVDEAYLSKRLNNMDIKEHIGNKVTDEVKGYVKNVGEFVNGNFKQVWPKQSLGWRKAFTLVENIIDGVKGFMQKHHPTGWFEDVGRDQKAVALASEMLHGKMLELDNLRLGVLKRFEQAWDKMSEADMEKMHDALVRGKIDVTTKNGEAAARKYGLNDEQIAAFKEYKKIADDIHAQLAKYLPDLEYRPTHYGQSIRWRRNGVFLDDAFDWTLNDEFSKFEGDKRYLKQKAEDRTTAAIKEDGLKYDAINPHELLMNYARDAYKMIAFHEMVEKGKTMKDSNGNPMVKWFDSDMKAAAKKFFPLADNATKFMQTYNLDEGYKIKMSDGSYYKNGENDVVFPSLKAAQDVLKSYAAKNKLDPSSLEVEALAGDKQHDVKGYSVIEKIDNAIAEDLSWSRAQKLRDELNASGKSTFVKKLSKGVYGVYERSYKELDRFQNDTEAQAFHSKLSAEGRQAYVKPLETKGTDKTMTGRLYFSEDLARMLNVVLAPDKIRRSAIGDKVMKAKNLATAFELSMSLFHAMTEGIEMTSTEAAWYQARYGMKNAYKSFAPRRAYQDSRTIKNIFERIVASPELANDPTLLKEANKVFGTTDVDVLDVIKQFYKFGGMMHQDTSLRSGVADMGMIDYGNFRQSMKDIWAKEAARIPDKPLQAFARNTAFTLSQPMTQWLMEEAIPRVKMAMFAKEYTLKLDQNREALNAGAMTREEIARDTMKFIEDRFGEVNWKNMWLDPTYKSSLQFLFRSFTWFTGSWKALGKAGIDMAKWGWINVAQGKGLNKETRYHLTEKGRWGMNVFITHMMMAGLISMAYELGAAIGGEEVPTPEDVPLLTRMLFPRTDALDPQARASIPSYVTEAFKIMSHLGATGQEAEPTKLISGRFNSLVSNALDVMLNEDYRGVTIRDGNPVKQIAQGAWHIFGIAPIMASTMYKEARDKGVSGGMIPRAFMGLTDAPAAAKRSAATNEAFSLRRKEYKGKTISPDERELKDIEQRAFYAYQQGDRSRVDELLRTGELSKRRFDIALTRMPRIMGQENSKYLDPLSQAFKPLTIDNKLTVWHRMTETEKKKHRPEMMKTYYNMLSRQDKSPLQKEDIRGRMKEYGLL